MKIALITSGSKIAHWQAEALRSLGPGTVFTLYDCTNSSAHRHLVRHGLYYALNLLAVRNPQTRGVLPSGAVPIAKVTEFEAIKDGSWERLPDDIVAQIAADGPDVILKLGMGLLRVPLAADLPCPILSYHHGDPRLFRGRPAGFYELLNGQERIGQVVQILSDRLDAGRVVAYAETKAHAHSWRRTLVDAYRVSPLLLPRAIANALSGTDLPIAGTGRNYRLPSNSVVLRFIAMRVAAAAKRLMYGLFWEKAWTVAEAKLRPGWRPDALGEAIDEEELRPFVVEEPHIFYADPFFHPASDAVLAEAMLPGGRGEIVSLTGGGAEPALSPPGHLSFPATIDFEGRHFLVPEMESWSTQQLYEVTASGIVHAGPLRLPVEERLIDPVLHRHDGACYLFANRAGEPMGVLRLWVGQSPFGPFAEHPASPILISPRGGRMAGLIIDQEGQLYRPGQELSGAYGDGLAMFRIEELTPARYREAEVCGQCFSKWHGPHTLNVKGNRALVDLYCDRFSLLAGVRRLRQTRAG